MHRIGASWSFFYYLPIVIKFLLPVSRSQTIMLLSFETDIIFYAVTSIAVIHLVCPLYDIGSATFIFLNCSSLSMCSLFLLFNLIISYLHIHFLITRLTTFIMCHLFGPNRFFSLPLLRQQ